MKYLSHNSSFCIAGTVPLYFGTKHLANEDQFNGINQTDELGEDEPIHSAESAKSITDSDSQTRQHKNHQAIQHNSYSVAVVNTESEEKKEIFQLLGKLGIGYLKAKILIEKYGHKRVAEVVQHTKNQNRKNPAGYIIRALAENWAFWPRPEKDDYPYDDGKRYITGKYAAFINH